ncbi:MAG: translation elongation factor-like protein [Candidatus Micrarchaeia archaeon]
MAERKQVGVVRHYYNKIGVAAIDLSDGLKVGDKIVIEANEGPVEQVVSSMQIEHKAVAKASAGQSVGMKVAARVREGDPVFKIVEG